MLSDKLFDLANQFYEYKDTGIELHPEGLKTIVGALLDLHKEAQALEANATMPPAVVSQADAYEAAVDRQQRFVLHVIDGGRKC